MGLRPRDREEAPASGLRKRRVVGAGTCVGRGGVHTGIGTHMGLGPVDEDFAHHPEQLLCVGIGLCQPMCSGVQEGTDKVCRCPQGRGSPRETQRTSWEPKDVQWCVGGSVLRESGQFSEKLKFQPFKKKFNLAQEVLELTAFLLPQLLEAYHRTQYRISI